MATEFAYQPASFEVRNYGRVTHDSFDLLRRDSAIRAYRPGPITS